MNAHIEATATREQVDDDGRQEGDGERRTNNHRHFDQALVRFLSSVLKMICKLKFNEHLLLDCLLMYSHLKTQCKYF